MKRRGEMQSGGRKGSGVDVVRERGKEGSARSSSCPWLRSVSHSLAATHAASPTPSSRSTSAVPLLLSALQNALTPAADRHPQRHGGANGFHRRKEEKSACSSSTSSIHPLPSADDREPKVEPAAPSRIGILWPTCPAEKSNAWRRSSFPRREPLFKKGRNFCGRHVELVGGGGPVPACGAMAS